MGVLECVGKSAGMSGRKETEDDECQCMSMYCDGSKKKTQFSKDSHVVRLVNNKQRVS